MADSVQSNQSGNVAPSHAPAPREKITVSLTFAQAEMLRALWQEHSAALHAMLTGWCGDSQNASDILQEIFRRLAESPAIMIRMKNARAFLAVSARRIAVDFARRSSTRSAYQNAAGEETPTAENPGPTDENLRAVIAKALNGLPAEQRSVFEHKILSGRTLEEISRLEGVSLNTVSSRLRYALDKIRGQLRPYYDDLNRKDFKNMKNDPSNTEDAASQRIITPLAPKRVPSVAPGLEGLAAMAPDACEAAPEIAVSEPEFVEASPAVELVEPEIANCGVGGNAWEQAVPEAVELPAIDGEGSQSEAAEESGEVFVTEEIPEMISCEILPEGGIPEGWLRPILVVESPEDLLTTLFEGESESGTQDGADLAGEGEPVSEEAVPYELESGFEICVLPIPEEFAADFDPNELLARYKEFLRENPDWGALDPDMMEIQVVTQSSVFGELEFGTPSKAAAFDSWYETMYAQGGSNGVGPVDGSGLVLDGSIDFDGGTVVTGGVIVDGSHPDGSGLTEGTSLVLSGGGSFTGGTILSGGVLTTGDADTHHPDGVKDTGSLVLDGRNTFGEIQPHWRGNGGAPEFAYSSAPGGAGLVLNGSAENFALSGDNSALSNSTPRFEETTVVTGGKLELDDDVTVNKAENNTLTLSNGATVVLQGGEVVSGENVYAYNPEFGSVSLPSSDAQLGAVDLPTEIAITGGEVAEAALPFGNVAAGLAPTPNQALIVEFSVLSPSEPLQASQVQAASHASDDLPQSMVSSSGGSTGTSGADAALSAALDDATLDNALPHVAASAQESELASNAGIKVDAPTAAAGAVAAGTVVHGGAAAPALRRPLPTL